MRSREKHQHPKVQHLQSHLPPILTNLSFLSYFISSGSNATTTKRPRLALGLGGGGNRLFGLVNSTLNKAKVENEKKEKGEAVSIAIGKKDSNQRRHSGLWEEAETKL